MNSWDGKSVRDLVPSVCMLGFRDFVRVFWNGLLLGVVSVMLAAVVTEICRHLVG